MELNHLKAKLDGIFGMESQVRYYPDHYATINYSAPTGVPIFSIAATEKEKGKWEITGAVATVLPLPF